MKTIKTKFGTKSQLLTTRRAMRPPIPSRAEITAVSRGLVLLVSLASIYYPSLCATSL